jgi:predicted hotdog family 3-hydroxylacyl-ACP dehydratase
VILLEPGVRVVAERDLPSGDPVLNEGGMLPSVTLVELMAQTGGLLLDDDPIAGGGLLAGLRRVHVHAAARAGETVVVTCTMVRRLGDILMVAAVAACGDGRVLAHGRIQIRRLAARVP